MIKYLVQDIETIPESEVIGDWNPVKSDNDRHPDKDPFPPIACHKVACIGMLALDHEFKPVKGGCSAGGLSGGKTEKEMVERWSHAASGALFESPPLRMVDYNGRGFDVPVLQTRAYRYGIPMPWYFGLLPDNKGTISQWSKEYRNRYSGMHMDVQELWTNCGAFRYPHLSDLAKLMGLPGKVGIDGSKVYEAYKEKRYAEIDTYCMQDVFQTALVLQRYQYISGEINLEEYRTAASATLEFIDKQPEHKDFMAAVNRSAVLLE